MEFLPPAHQALEHVKGLLREEVELRDIQDLGSPEWFALDRNVQVLKRYPEYLKSFPGFDAEKERRDLAREKATIAAHNRPVLAERKRVREERDAALSRLADLIHVRWAIDNHRKITGRKVYGEMDRVPPLEGGDPPLFGKKPGPIDIRGITQEGLEKVIEEVRGRLDRLELREDRLSRMERTTALHPRLDFMGREEFLRRALGE